MVFSTVSDVRALLPGVLTDDTTTALIQGACDDSATEVMTRLATLYTYDDIATAPMVVLASKYLAAANYLTISVSAGQEYGEPRLAEYYRGRGNEILDAIVAGAPVLDTDGEQIESTASSGAMMRGYLVQYE